MRYLLIILLSFGCAKQGEKALSGSRSDSTGPELTIVYTYENDTLFQKIEIKLITESKIGFVLTSKNVKTGISSRIEGTAESNVNGDPEIDEDEDGNAYPSQEYIFDGERCDLSIRIDVEEKSRLRVIESNCESHDKRCPFGSVRILRRK